ncbi:signal peptidase I [Ferruginibacter sp.]
MKKIWYIVASVCTAIIALWFVANVTGMLQRYKISTSANEPTIKIGDHVFISNLKTPRLLNYVVFASSYEDSILAIAYQSGTTKNSRYMHRLCGMPGDTIKMVDAVLFVNNINVDEKLNVKNDFIITKEAFALIGEEDMPQEMDANTGFGILKDSAFVRFDNSQIKKYQSKIKFSPNLNKDSISADGPFKWLDKNLRWTADNFGPFIIPQDCYFVLGDNRHSAMDSRYTGFIKKADIKGVVLSK